MKFSHHFLLKSATLLAVITSTILISSKFFAYNLSGSLSIKASLIDSCLDALLSMITLFAVHHSLKPADANHKFGHQKGEALAGLLQAIVIMASALWLLNEVFLSLLTPRIIHYHPSSTIIMTVSSILLCFLIKWQKFVIKKTQSIALKADCLHYQTDLFMNLSVITSNALAYFLNFEYIDSITAVIIVIYISKTSIEIGRKSFHILMDGELDTNITDQIYATVRSVTGVKKVFDVRTRASSEYTIFIQMNLQLDENLLLRDAHTINEDIRRKIQIIIPTAEIIIQHTL